MLLRQIYAGFKSTRASNLRRLQIYAGFKSTPASNPILEFHPRRPAPGPVGHFL